MNKKAIIEIFYKKFLLWLSSMGKILLCESDFARHMCEDNYPRVKRDKNCLVRSSLGFSNTSKGSPCSKICPSSIKIT